MKKKSESYSRLIYAISRVIITRPTKFLFHMEIIGAENWPEHGPAILAANHSSNMDPPLVCLSYPGYISWMGKVEVLMAPVLGWYL
ncbi:MAG: lysophospholipid acyltransferase family protein, partial [Actinomycetota bacterium]